jgi:hypothetical protein
MKKSKAIDQRLAKLCEEELPSLSNVLIVAGDNEIQMFQKYTLRKSDTRWLVTMVNRATVKEFPTAKIAACWCIAHRNESFDLTFNIEKYLADFELYSDQAARYKKMISKVSDFGKSEILESKRSQAQFKTDVARRELDKCLNIAKYWQTIGFNNETSRFIPKKNIRSSM